MARSGAPAGNLELLDGPCGPPWEDIENQSVHYFFHCSELLGSTWIFMSVLHKLYENQCFHSYSKAKWTSEFHAFLMFSFKFLTINKNKENMNYLFLITISIVLSSGAPPMHMFFSIEMFKEIHRKRTCSNI